MPDEAPLSTRLVDDLSFLLARANALSIAAGNAALQGHGLKVRSYSVLSLAAESVPPSQREIAEFLRLDPSQVVTLVDDLQARGLVAREPDARDRRANVIAASASGRRLLDSARAAVTASEQVVHSALSPEERTELAALLRKAASLP